MSSKLFSAMECAKLFRHIRALTCRQINTSSVCLSRTYRRENGLPLNHTMYGPLTDLPDYTYLDGRVTPIGARQGSRLIKQRMIAEKIIKLSGQVDFAKEHYHNKIVQKENEQKAILSKRLKSKGHLLLKKSE